MKKFVFSAIVFVLLAVLADGCKKKPDPVDPETLELNDNVKIVRTIGFTLNVGASNIANGTYVFSHFGSDPRIEVGDILVSDEGDGYIRKIVSITINGNTYTIQTTQGTLEDIYKQGRLVFNVDLNF